MIFVLIIKQVEGYEVGRPYFVTEQVGTGLIDDGDAVLIAS